MRWPGDTSIRPDPDPPPSGVPGGAPRRSGPRRGSGAPRGNSAPQGCDAAPAPPRLSPRLRALAEAVPPGAVVADVGADHALLPAFLVRTGRCPRAIAIDARPGPLAGALRTLRRYGVQGRVELRQGDGLEPLRPGEADVVVIAGLGGETIAGIIAGRPEVAGTVRRWVLQPVRGREALRRYLAGQGWRVVEGEVAEGRRRYAVMVAEPGGRPPDAAREGAGCG